MIFHRRAEPEPITEDRLRNFKNMQLLIDEYRYLVMVITYRRLVAGQGEAKLQSLVSYELRSTSRSSGRPPSLVRSPPVEIGEWSGHRSTAFLREM